MKLRSLFALGAVLALVLAACGGASSNEVKTAKTAHYKGDKSAIFAAMKDAIEAKLKIDRVDQSKFLVETTGQWFTPEGLGASERMDDIRDVPANSIHIHFIVALVPDGDTFVVDVRPKWFKYIQGSTKPEPLGEDDISVPG